MKMRACSHVVLSCFERRAAVAGFRSFFLRSQARKEGDPLVSTKISPSPPRPCPQARYLCPKDSRPVVDSIIARQR